MSSNVIYRAILFDMDGVIIDTRSAVTEFWIAQAARYRVSLSELDFERDIYGCLPGRTLDRLFPNLSTGDRQAVLKELDASERVQTYHAMPGVIELLRALLRAGIPTALVTSGNRNKIGAVSEQLGLERLFTTRVGAEEIKHSKPAPDGYLQAARQLNKLPCECVVFEDALSGVQAAVAAGTRCVGVQLPGRAAGLVSAGAMYVIPDFCNVDLVVRHHAASQGLYDLEIGAKTALCFASTSVSID